MLLVVALCFLYSLANHCQLALVLSDEGKVIIPRFDAQAQVEAKAAQEKLAKEEAEKKAAAAAAAK